jgi:tRNA1Val (adenine37-N6)-methyltransferase
MKIGTDAVLLGSWADIINTKQILDIGTGCGIIALMLAQRSDAEIDAVEIDPDSSKEAAINFKNAPWSNRLNSIETDIHEFAKSNLKKYDLIVSNPPFFSNSMKSPDLSKNLSKHDTHLNIGELVRISKKMLLPSGRVSVIVPSGVFLKLTEIARKQNLYIYRQLNIIPKQGKPANRVLVELNNYEKSIAESTLTIRHHDGSYTQEYKNLTSEFYLHFK